MKLIKYATAAAVLAAALGTSAASYAGDCKQVKFKFTNKVKVANTNVEIKVKKIYITGNDGSWNEDISNKVIAPTKTYTTNKRKLNKLDSGKKGTFKVYYDRRQIGPGWVAETQTFSGKPACTDGRTYSFWLNKS